MTGYDKNTIPKPSNTTVRVEFVMYVLCAEMDSVTGLLKTSAWKQMVRMYMYLASSVKFPFAIAENGKVTTLFWGCARVRQRVGSS